MIYELQIKISSSTCDACCVGNRKRFYLF